MALDVFEETGYYLGIGLANLINTLNIQVLEISGVQQLSFQATPLLELTVRRAHLALDLTAAGQCFAQQAEALVTSFPRAAT